MNDWEECGTCGYDHEYEYVYVAKEIERLHKEAGDLPIELEE